MKSLFGSIFHSKTHNIKPSYFIVSVSFCFLLSNFSNAGFEPMDADVHDFNQEAADYNNTGGTYQGTSTERDFYERNEEAAIEAGYDTSRGPASTSTRNEGDHGDYSGGAGNNSLAGGSGSDNLDQYGNPRETAYNEQMKKSVAYIEEYTMWNRFISPEDRANARQKTLERFESQMHSLAVFNDTGVLTQSSEDAFKKEVLEFLEDNFYQFSGGYTGALPIALTSDKIHGNSKNIVAALLNALKVSQIQDPLSKLGLLGAKIYVVNQMDHSFYSPTSDTIYLAIKDVQKYGMAVLYHELLHAGLTKSFKSKILQNEAYRFLSGLNHKQFNGLNGYVGRSMGYYSYEGYGYQEAFVIGWSFLKINSRAAKIRDSKNPWIAKAFQYREDIFDNKALAKMPNNSVLRMISSTNLSRDQVKDKFLKFFLEPDRQIRKVGQVLQDRTNAHLPNLCAPGEKVTYRSRSCTTSSRRYEYERSYEMKVCQDNYRWSEVYWTGCGRVVENLR